MTLLAALPGTLASMGGGMALWRRVDDGARHALLPHEAGVLRACSRYAMRDAHLAQLQAMGLSREHAASIFDGLVARGLIGDFPAVLALRGDAREAATPADVDPLLVIRSYQRPAGVSRLLDSIAADVRDGARPRRVLIVDDTRDAAFAAQTQALARTFAASHGNEVRYLGPAQCADAVSSLAAWADADREVLATMLDPSRPSAVTGSRTWNWAVLAAAGGFLSILDDDTSFPLRLPADASTRCDVADASEAIVTFFDDDGWRDAARVPGDPYEWLAAYLVDDAGAALRARGWRPDALVGREPAEFDYLLRATPVAGVVPGLYGGIALDTAAFLLHANPPTFRNLMREPFDLARLESNRLWHAYPFARFTSHAVYTPLLLDARAPLPFAGTWGRVDDTYFLMLLRAMAGDVAFAHVPAMLGHVDLSPRDRLRHAREALVIDRNGWLAGRFDGIGRVLHGADRWRRLAAIAAVCATRADERDAALADDLLAFRNGMRAKLVTHLVDGLEGNGGAPASWRETLAQAIAANRVAMRDDRPSAEELAICRGALRQVVDAAAAWPRAFDAMRAEPDAWRRISVDARAG